ILGGGAASHAPALLWVAARVEGGPPVWESGAPWAAVAAREPAVRRAVVPAAVRAAEIPPLLLRPRKAQPAAVLAAPVEPAAGLSAAALSVAELSAVAPLAGPERLGHARPAAWRQTHEAHRSERSEEHTSELQSRSDLVCRLL